VGLQRAILVDRDPMLLSRITGELSRSGYLVETIDSTVGLTPDLLELSNPDLLVLDAELPGIKHSALLVIVRSLKARQSVKVIISSEQNASLIRDQLGADLAVPRSKLIAHGAAALGLNLTLDAEVDVRAIIDEVLGKKITSDVQVIELRIDMFSKANFYIGQDSQLGVFVPANLLLPVGQRVELQMDLLGRHLIKLTGEVAWKRSHSALGGRIVSGMGVKPREIPAADKKTIAQFLETREPLAWPP
jgi:CheY-like chemotaxis protein